MAREDPRDAESNMKSEIALDRPTNESCRRFLELIPDMSGREQFLASGGAGVHGRVGICLLLSLYHPAQTSKISNARI